MACPGAYAHVIADYTDDELEAALDVATGRRHGLDSFVIENFKEVQVHPHAGYKRVPHTNFEVLFRES